MQYSKEKVKFEVNGSEFSANIGKLGTLIGLQKVLSDGRGSKESMDIAYEILRNILEDDFDLLFKDYMYDFFFLAELIGEILVVATEKQDAIVQRYKSIEAKYKQVGKNEKHTDSTAAEE